MKIRRLAIQNFRRFSAPLVIDQIGDGLTVLAGDNEEGKSTILRALRAALFDRHRLSKDLARGFVPFNAEVQPEVAVDFEIGGQAYRLRKGFYQQPYAELQTPRERITGPAVEEKLAEILRFDSPARGLAKTEDQGVWGLLWLEQGTTFANLNAAMRRDGSAHKTVLSALEGEVGEVLGGAHGRDLLDAIARRYSEFFDKNRKPRGEYAKALSRVEEVRAELQAVQADLQGYDNKVDELARLRERLTRYDVEGRLARAQQERQDAEEEQRRIESLDVKLREAQGRQQVAEAETRACEGRLRAREELLRRVQAGGAALQERRQARQAAMESLLPLQGALSAARAGLDAAQAEEARCEREVKGCEARAQAAQLAAQVATLQRRVGEAAQAHERSLAARGQADAIAVDAARLRTIVQLDRARADAEAGLAAVATRLSFALEPDVALRLAGQRLAPGQPLIMTETTELQLEKGDASLGQLLITPGAEDLAPRRARVEAARQKLAAALDAVGMPDVATAEARAKDRADLEVQATQLAQIAAAHAPEGLDALRAMLLRLGAELKAACGDEDPAAVTAVDGGAGSNMLATLAAARAAREAAVRNVNAQRMLCDREGQALQVAQADVTRAEVEQAAAEREEAQASAALGAARGREGDEALRITVSDWLAQRRAAEDSTRQAQAALLAARPEEVRLRLASKRDAVAQIQRDIEATTRQVMELEIELRALGQQGLGERQEELVAELERARALASRMTREGDAVRLLYETLSAAEREAKESFFEPVRRRVQPYLDLLFPGGALRFSDGDLAISHLQRAGQEEPFDALSIGTREQLAVLSRLGFADLLREQGQPTAIVLDDALVYSDDARFERMLYVLRRAAQHQQILVLTCRERDYLSSGFEIRRLADCQGGALRRAG